MPAVGFILVTHNRPDQIVRLVNRLNLSFDFPPIVCHHDFSKSALDLTSFSRNVSFVQPHLVTGWAQFSVVEATIRAFKMMFERSDAPRWAVLLSGADYPIKPAECIVADLNLGDYDAHLSSYLITWQTRRESRWHGKCFRRYCTNRFVLPSLDRHFQPRQRALRLRIPWYSARTLPFDDRLRCYAGRQWFSLNQKAAETIFQFHQTRPEVGAHYRDVMFSEESYFQTVLVNAAELRINRNDWRYVDFRGDAAHPRTLTLSDLPRLLASPCHFARKFDLSVDAQVVDELDSFLDRSSVPSRRLPSLSAETMSPSSAASPASLRLVDAGDPRPPDNR